MEAGTSSDFSHAQTLNCFAEQYQAELLRMCCLYLRDAELAKDAVQETYLKAYRALDGFRGECAEKVNGVYVQRLTICYNCVGTLEFPKELPLNMSKVLMQTRKGVRLAYEPDAAKNESATG